MSIQSLFINKPIYKEKYKQKKLLILLWGICTCIEVIIPLIIPVKTEYRTGYSVIKYGFPFNYLELHIGNALLKDDLPIRTTFISTSKYIFSNNGAYFSINAISFLLSIGFLFAVIYYIIYIIIGKARKI